MTRGTRYSLFVVDEVNGLGQKDVYMLNKAKVKNILDGISDNNNNNEPGNNNNDFNDNNDNDNRYVIYVYVCRLYNACNINMYVCMFVFICCE